MAAQVWGSGAWRDQPLSRDDLIAAREALIAEIVGEMPDSHRQFLISFERGEADWTLLGVSRAADLPAVKWRQQKSRQADEGETR